MIESVQERSEEVDEAIAFDQFMVNTLQVNLANKQPYLLRKPGTLDGTPVTIMLNCRASTNVIRPGLASRVIITQ